MQQCGHVQGERKLRAISPKTQIIIITANDKDSIRGEFIRNGAIAFFVKPFDDGEFLAAVPSGDGFGDITLCPSLSGAPDLWGV
ncbi:MAG: hypothetical protein JO170_23600 [Verrucomicrobia bacterium]|nr:hypothetical protein [Verrucomicrobiota bacterium]